MKHYSKHLNLVTTTIISILSILSVVSFINSCSDSSSEDSSFLTAPCSESWQNRYSMLSLDLSWVLDSSDIDANHPTTNKNTYKVSSKNENSISFSVDNPDSSDLSYQQETKSEFETKCEQTKSLFFKNESSIYNESKTISGKTYDCKYILTTLSKEEALSIDGSSIINQATSDVLYKAYLTSKEMFPLSYELSFKIDNEEHIIRKDIVSMN